MLIASLAAVLLLASPDARLSPIIPGVISPWEEAGNRHARRRDRKRARIA